MLTLNVLRTLIAGQNHLIQSLLYSKLLIISWTLLTTVLKVKIRVVIWVQSGCLGTEWSSGCRVVIWVQSVRLGAEWSSGTEWSSGCRVAVSTSVVYPCDLLGDWDLWPLLRLSFPRASYGISIGQEKIKIQKLKYSFY